MSRFDLRDVSERLTKSNTVESVISEFLRSLEAMRSDWRASLAFYEVSQDSLVDVYELDQRRLVRRNIVVPVDGLPHRLVRKVFQTTAPIHQNERETVFSQPGASPHYLADPREASDLMALTVLTDWESCICLPLGYQDDLIAMLVVVSAKKNAFAGKALAEIMPLKSIATVALAQNLYRSARHRTVTSSQPVDDSAERMKREMQLLTDHTTRLDQESRERTARIETLLGQIETLDRSSSTYKDELERVKVTVGAMEEHSEAAIEFLTEAYQQLQSAHWTLEDLEQTVLMLKDVFQLLAEEHPAEFLAETIVEWFVAHLELGRCTLLVPDPSGQALTVAAHRGMDPEIVGRVRVRVGQGVAGWVAAHRKPLYVRVREDAQSISRSGDGTYNSDSFIVVPLVHGGRMLAVLNLSNRLDGEGFGQADLDRAMLAASAFAVAFGGQQTARQAAAWA
jgi:transcriptional regulator with GAF, ATPase, and Fis domain